MTNGLTFGTIVTKVVVKNGNEAIRTEETTESIYISSKQEMLDYIFQQLDRLKDYDNVDFKIFNDKQHEPCRMEITKAVKH